MITTTRTLLLIAITCMLGARPGVAQHTDDSTHRESLAVTIYNSNLGVVRDVRRFDIPDGHSEILLRNVPTSIDPTTVKITALSHPHDVAVQEQNYEYDLVSQDKLLQKYIDHSIEVTDDKGVKLQGTLLALESDKLTLQTSTGILMLPNLTRYTINVPSLPNGLITRPTLVWQLAASRKLTNEPLEVLYQTGGMSWHAEYIAALSDDDKSIDLSGWVSLENNSGATFPNAKLKLIAGDLHRVTQGSVAKATMYGRQDMAASAPQFQERGLFEYHIYDLQHPTTIKNNEVKQVSLLEASGVSVEKRYTYRGGRNAEVTISFLNSEANHLGIPIPMGTVRVMKRDKDGSLEFVGEDHIDHTPRDEKLTLKVGDAFDVLGERVTTDSRSLGPQTNQETIEITLKNRKEEDITIDVEESVGGNWEITKSSVDYPYEKKNAYTIVWHVPVKKLSEQKLTYTIIHHW